MPIKSLPKRGGRAKVGGFPNKAPTMTPVEPQTSNSDDPRGRFGRFLRAHLARKGDKKGDDLADALGMESGRSIRLWMQGETGPAFKDLDRVARAIGYENWAKLAVAVERFCEKNPE